MRRLTLGSILLVGSAAVMLAQPDRPEAAMLKAAKALIAALDETQAAKIRWPFDSDERFNWYFVPRERKGLPLKEMNEQQRAAAFALLRAGLGASGYTKAETIRSLENVLRAIEGRAIRDPELYYVTIFGEPSDTGSWGWRYEGHHISQHWTVVKGKAIATTPAFFGANPAEVRDGPMKGTRALAAEEDLARALLASLTDEQRRRAIVAEKAPNDILTSNSRKAAILENTGIPADALTGEQRAILIKLLEEYASTQPPALAEQRLSKVRAAGPASIRFAWMGSTTKAPGNGNYYRIQGPTFLIEYDNTQNEANHQHTVWRDFDGDFGVDLLADHYAHDPHHAGRPGAPARAPLSSLGAR
jgi:hypothetical protein